MFSIFYQFSWKLFNCTIDSNKNEIKNWNITAKASELE